MVLFIQPALDITYNVASASSITALSSKRLKLKKAKSDLKVYGFTDKELNSLSYKNILSLDKNVSKDRIYGFWGGVKTCAKSVRYFYKLAPKSVKKQIRRYGIKKLIQVIDRISGTSSKLVHFLCKKVHISRKWANILARIVNIIL